MQLSRVRAHMMEFQSISTGVRVVLPRRSMFLLYSRIQVNIWSTDFSSARLLSPTRRYPNLNICCLLQSQSGSGHTLDNSSRIILIFFGVQMKSSKIFLVIRVQPPPQNPSLNFSTHLRGPYIPGEIILVWSSQ